MADRKLSKARAYAAVGELLRAWNTTWNVTISLALAIDKVKFSFFKTGEPGQGFDLFFDAGLWYEWCQDLLDRTMGKVLAAEKQAGEQYPKYYNLPNFGTEGRNSLGLALANKPGHVVINGKKDQARAVVLVPIMGEDGLRLAAEKFIRIYEKHLDELAAETAENAQRWFKDHASVEEDTEPALSAAEPAAQEVQEAQELFPDPAPDNTPATAPFVGLVQGVPIQTSDGFVFKAMVDGEVFGVQFNCEPTPAISAGTGEFKCVGVKEGKLIKVSMFL